MIWNLPIISVKIIDTGVLKSLIEIKETKMNVGRITYL